MPSSASESIPFLIEFIRKNKPDLQSVLDIGVGFGKGGFLLREYYEARNLNFKPKDWRLKIIGVDIHSDYLSELQKIIYNKIIIGDIFQILPTLDKYDLAILSDIIEHFSKNKGLELLVELFKHVEDIVIATPYGFLKQPAIGKYVHEEHKSGWMIDDFKNFKIVDKAIIPRIRKNQKILVVYLRRM